jgi:hypothetical protein
MLAKMIEIFFVFEELLTNFRFLSGILTIKTSFFARSLGEGCGSNDGGRSVLESFIAGIGPSYGTQYLP